MSPSEVVNVAVPPLSLEMQREIVKADLLAKYLRGDWHGVRDAAVDIELLEVRIAAKAAPG